VYSRQAMEHFKHPRNMGRIRDADGIGRVGNPLCGDVMHMSIRVREGRIADIRFQTFGCVAAIATSSMTTELAKGKTLEQALGIGRDDVARALKGLPPIKMHCSNLASEALHAAIRDYYRRKGAARGQNKS
jgi:nitrogen fixation NifU-like protein